MAIFKGKSKLTPEQRRAKLEAARKAEAEAQALLSEVEQDETVSPSSSQSAPVQTAAKPIATTPIAKPAVKPVVQPVVSPSVPTSKTVPQPVLAAVRANETGPGGDTRKSGQPSLSQTLKTVWENMHGKPAMDSKVQVKK